LPDAFGPVNGLAPLVAVALGAATGHLMAAGHLKHRVIAVVIFGGTTMLCAATALKAATVVSGAAPFIPDLVPQVATTAMFVLGLMGGITPLGMRRPIILINAPGRA
jgi:hypothetical protein